MPVVIRERVRIQGTELHLKAGVNLDYESQTSYDVTVQVDDVGVGSAPDATQNFTLSVGDVNEAPTALALANQTTNLNENTDTTSSIKVADIVTTDDALGVNTYSLVRADAARSELQ